jgi:hypothetical protein
MMFMLGPAENAAESRGRLKLKRLILAIDLNPQMKEKGYRKGI